MNLHDAINAVEPLEVPATFSRRNLTEFGVDVVHRDGIGGKFWIRFKSVMANDAQRMKETIEGMSIS